MTEVAKMVMNMSEMTMTALNLTLNASTTTHDPLSASTTTHDPLNATGSDSFNATTMGNDTFDVEFYISSKLGAKRLRYIVLLPMTVLYSVIAIGGLVGNVLTCLVIARNRSMRTSTNYYLVNLAAADILTLTLALPIEVYQFWEQYPWLWGDAACRVRAMVPETMAHVSVLTILAVSGERYVAITNPVYARTTHTLARTAWVVPVIWLVSLLAAAPWGYYQQVNLLPYPNQPLKFIPESAWCAIPFMGRDTGFSWLMWMSSVGAFILPMTVLVTLYCRIGMVLAIDPPTRTPTAGDGAMHTRKLGIRMLVAVVVAFFLCWAPFHAQRLMFAIVTSSNTWTKALLHANAKLYFFTGACYYLNSAINPILYSVMSVRFRNALRRSLCGGRDWARRQHHNRSNTVVRTRELSTASTRRLQEVSNRNGFGVHYGFEKMDMEV